MKKQIIFISTLFIFLIFLSCSSTTANTEPQEIIPVVETPSEEVTDKEIIVEKPQDFSNESVDFTVESEFPTEQVVQLTAVEMYQNFISDYVLEPVSTPNQITKNRQFSKPFSVKCTKDGNPVSNVLITIKYPVAQTNGVIAFGQTITETNEEGIASFTPSNTSFSCNSNLYFFFTPETEDSETLEYAEKNAVSIPYKVITNRFYDSGILAIADYNASNRALSTNTTATALQPPLRKAGFQTIGNAPFDASIITSKNIYTQAKNLLGNTVSFMIYGTVKYAEPTQILETGEYSVTFVTNFSVMNLKDGKIVYTEEFFTTELGASEWEATNKLRTKTIPELITQKIIYGI